ncbi:MAG: Ig-like domain-containing protein, partial [Candidatus Saccharimonadales bacterium]
MVPIINGTVLADDDYNSFSVTSPSHGDNWQGGSTHDITWSSNSHNNVDISYTLDDTASHPIWVSISNNAPSSDSSSNSYAWTLPSESSTYTHAEIEIDLDYSSSKAFSSEFTISPAISKPIVKDVSSSTAFQTPVVINLTSDITGSDITSVNVSTNPGNATAIVSGESVTYTPNNGFTGSDSFYYTATNPGGTSNPAKVSIQVNAPSKPTVSNVYTSTAYQTSLPIDLSSDINGQDITSVNVVYGPNHGTTSVSGETV